MWWPLLAGCGPSDDDGGRHPPTTPPTDSGTVATGSTAETGTTGTGTVSVTEEPGVACTDPSVRDTAKFSIVTLPYAEPGPWYEFDGSGVGVGDFDRDGRLDFLVLGHDAEEYMRQTPTGFVQVVSGWRDPGIVLSRGFGAAVADYDADGDLDVYVTRYQAPDVLLQNDGTGYFVDAAPALGLADDDQHHTSSATWTDYDNDGDLDLYVAGHGDFLAVLPDPDRLWRNEGDGTFADASSLLPQRVHDSFGFVPLFLDFDGDGWRDLYLANDMGTAWIESMLVWNRGGEFVLDGNAAGLDQLNSAMGIGVGDLNDDLTWDLVLPVWANIYALYSNSSLGIWIDYADSVGLFPDDAKDQVVGWGADLSDLDNDTRLDAIVTFGRLRLNDGELDSRGNQQHDLWLQQADGTFVSEAAAWGFDWTDPARGLAVVDLDRNGWLDVVVPSYTGATRLYLANCGAASWLEVALAEPGTMNPDAIGAVVEVEVGGKVLRRPMLAGGIGYGTGPAPVVHFGLADAEQVDRLVVRWPDGAESVVTDVAARRKIIVTRN